MKPGFIAAGILIVIAAAVAVIVAVRHTSKREAAMQRMLRELNATEVPAIEPATQPSQAEAQVDSLMPVAAAPVEKSPVPVSRRPALASAPKPQSLNKDSIARADRSKQIPSSPAGNEPDPQQPVARIALSYVGEDPAAEAVWIASINDPNVSAHDRSDLIEDQNEEGFDDPHNITNDDLPLIENRLALIERLAPQSMDDTNAAAFAEAYKDLVNMRAKLVGR
jgi:hypothetical protein